MAKTTRDLEELLEARDLEELLDVVWRDAKAQALLKAKAKWEHLSVFEILRYWGDPREWTSYKDIT